MTDHVETGKTASFSRIAPGHRRLLVLCGERERSLQQLARLLDAPVDLYLGEPPTGLKVRRNLPQEAARQLLGGETASLVFDAHGGFDPDAFGAACGLLMGGGVFVLLTPDFAQWPTAPDRQNKNLVVYPHAPDQVSGRYLRRLISVIESDPYRQLAGPDAVDPVCQRIGSGAKPPLPVGSMTPDQQRAVAAMTRVALQQHERPLVLVADRGRGKSAALGLGAAALLAQRDLRIIVTAPARSATDAVFRHAGEEAGRLRFMAPDELLREKNLCDLLLVDEAAAIPASLLQDLLRQYPRVVFATTEHGYEGSGRGFAVRFRRTLDKQAPGWEECRLITPVRWLENDPLEQFCFRALMLDAEPASLAADTSFRVESLRAEWLDRDCLWRDETTLRELFGLLVLAHYETRPVDLRYLLDALNLSVVVMRARGKVLATALVAREGRLDARMAKRIVQGYRRPQGHLLAQTLGIVCADERVPELGGDRIVRIAVLPEWQGRGIGSALLCAIEARATADGCDYVGASFGVDSRILGFWRNGGYLPARLGVKRNRASGAHSLVVVKGLGTAGKRLAQKTNALFREQMVYALPDLFAELDPALAQALCDGDAQSDLKTEDTEQRILHDFAHHRRSWPDSIAAINQLAARGVSGLDEWHSRLMQERVVQHKSWKQCADACGLSGRKQALAALRRAVATLLGDHHHD